MGVILSGKHVKPTLSIKRRQLSLWASINVMNCNYIYIVYLLYLNKPDEATGIGQSKYRNLTLFHVV